MRVLQIGLGVVAVVVVCAAAALAASPGARAWTCAAGDRATGRVECMRYARGEKYAPFVKAAKDAVVRDFHDPASAQWRDLFISHAPKEGPVLCGEVNAKNRMGAYVGYRPFYFTPGRPAGLRTVAEDRDDETFKIIRGTYCNAKVEDVPSAS